MTASVRRVVMFFLALAAGVVVWELYKVVGPAKGGRLLGARLLPKTENSSMPHVWDMLRRFGRPETRGSKSTIFNAVAAGAWYSFRIAFVGLVMGFVVGMAMAIVMARFRVVERGLLPWLIVSQTVPLIALAPLVVSWGGRLKVGGFTWQRWMSAAVISAFLAFFPIAVGGLKGLKSPPVAAVELMESYAARWREGLMKLRLPAAVPFLVPALKLGAASAVVGTIVAEISTGLKGGIGRLIIEYSREATGDPAKVFTAVFGAIGLGLALAGIIALVDAIASRNRPKEVSV
jgi:NitT/TauT family transport system permease protein